MEATGLYVAGDAVVGKGRVAQALQTGLDAAERILGSA
jgi:predicted NAD/FAD-dependent oxidoreductase